MEIHSRRLRGAHGSAIDARGPFPREARGRVRRSGVFFAQ